MPLHACTTNDNAGLLEATATGTLDVKDAEINNTAATLGTTGTVVASTSTLSLHDALPIFDGAGKLALQGGTITGQALNHGNELVNFDNAIVGTGTISNLEIERAHV